MATNLIPIAFKALTGDGWLLFVTRFARLFAYGSLSVILVFYLVGLGLTEAESGLVLTLTLAGDVGGLACADTLAGSLATALGALCGGLLTPLLQQTSMAPVASYRVVVLMYGALGMLLEMGYSALSNC